MHTLTTWRNHKINSASLARRLDRFIIKEPLMEKFNLIRCWVRSMGILYHCLIFLEIFRRYPKPCAPVKFNSTCLGDEDFHCLVKKDWWAWDPYENISLVDHLAQNIHRIKKRTIEWAKAKSKKDEEALYKVEEELASLEDPLNGGFVSLEKKQHVTQIEADKIKLLREREETWILVPIG